MTRAREATIRRFVLTSFLIISATDVNARNFSMPYPEYSYLKHPMKKYNPFSRRNIVPVIMKKYLYYYGSGSTSTEGAVFTPRKANYLKHTSSELFIENLDSLCLPKAALNEEDRDRFLEVDLNGPARVFILLVPKSKNMDLGTVTSTTGLDATWTNLQVLSSATRNEISVGGNSRPSACKLPAQAVSLERDLARGEKLVLPLPQTININGSKNVNQFHLLFARPGPKDSKPVAFRYPKTPARIKDLITRTSTTVSPVKPNENCPSWLHNLYVTPSRTDRKFGEPKYWRTWHPIVDPIYWCYFDHEHGSYPGKYDPQFDYTAFKTEDNTTTHERQEESNQGFKVFAVSLPKEQRFVVLTIHMQCSQPRRITTRFHTGIFAVLDKDWILELELHMKVDFGGSVASRKGEKALPIDKEQEAVLRALFKQNQLRRRRINVLDLSNYPSSVDQNFVVRQNLPLTMENKKIIEFGVYEKWSAGPNTCSSAARGSFLSFDSRNAATAKKKITDRHDAKLQMLRGNSMNRKLVVSQRTGGVKIGVEFCKFGNISWKKGETAFQKSKGVFYTDPYFSTVLDRGGKNAVRQFIKPGFETVTLDGNDYLPVSPWGGFYKAGHDRRKGKFMNIEGAVSQYVN